MADGVQTLEKRLQRLELLLAAESSPNKVVRMDTTGEPGALEAHFDEVARNHGFEDHAEMGAVAHTVFAGVSAPYLQGRRVGITSPEQAAAFMAGDWTPYSRSTSSSTNSLTKSPQGTSEAISGSHTKGEAE